MGVMLNQNRLIFKHRQCLSLVPLLCYFSTQLKAQVLHLVIIPFLQRDKQGQAITMRINESLAIITIIVDSHTVVSYLLVVTLRTIPERKN